MDNTTGNDYLCVLYSANALDIEQIMQQVKTGVGSFTDRLQNAVGPQMADPSIVKYTTNGQIGFRCETADKTVVSIVLKTKHVE